MDEAKVDDHVSGVTERPSWEKTVRFEEESETSLKGDGDGRERSCAISSEPTKPTPMMATESGDLWDMVNLAIGMKNCLFVLRNG